MIDRESRVATFKDRQYRSGDAIPPGSMLPESTYSAALDALVIVCVDCIPVHKGRVLLSRRVRLPHASWWINGGRMQKGELYCDAATRLMRVELSLELDPERFNLVGFYGLMWDVRAQEPKHHGCHTLSVTHAISLSSDEVERITLNNEYDGFRWVAPQAIVSESRSYHPALVRIMRDFEMQTRAGTHACASFHAELLDPGIIEMTTLKLKRGI